ncbi:MAG: hypothetical protein H8E73_10445 [Planctomycetes bacterium]|nr:hypothetical protein [Planctomycetota bacterium]
MMTVPVGDSVLWATNTADVRGLAVGSDGLVALHHESIEAISPSGRSLWRAQLPATPVRWGLALTGSQCVVSLSDGSAVCLAKDL